MPFNDPNRPKILRTQLDEDTHTQFKMLAAELHTTMGDLVEVLIKERLKRDKE